jgi:diguanylate cyclase (GGDEF)-like protein
VGDLAIAAAIAADAWLEGGTAAPCLALMAWPIVAAAGRHTLRGLAVYTAFCAAAVGLACGFALKPAAGVADLRFAGVLTMLGGVTVLVVALTRAERQAREQSLIDPLTGLLNRLALDRRVEELKAQAAIGVGSLCIVAGDLDNFKDVNDTHGHDVGDTVLREVAEVLRTTMRAYPLLYRMGGEEFVAVLPGLDHHEGERIAERLRTAIEQSRPANLEITMSFGVAASAGDELDTTAVFKAADRCLYRAKAAGRNRVVTRRGFEHAQPAAQVAQATAPVMRAA